MSAPIVDAAMAPAAAPALAPQQEGKAPAEGKAKSKGGKRARVGGAAGEKKMGGKGKTGNSRKTTRDPFSKPAIHKIHKSRLNGQEKGIRLSARATENMKIRMRDWLAQLSTLAAESMMQDERRTIYPRDVKSAIKQLFPHSLLFTLTQLDRQRRKKKPSVSAKKAQVAAVAAVAATPSAASAPTAMPASSTAAPMVAN